MFKSILRWLFRVKPAPAPVERPPMAVRNNPSASQRQTDAIARLGSGPHGVRSAAETAARRQAQANRRIDSSQDEHSSMFMHPIAMGDFYSGGDSSSCDTSSSSSSSSCD